VSLVLTLWLSLDLQSTSAERSLASIASSGWSSNYSCKQEQLIFLKIILITANMKKYLATTPGRGKAAKPKPPPKAKTQKKPLAVPLSDYEGDDYEAQMDYNDRESRSASPDDDFFSMPVRPTGNDFSSDAWGMYFASAFEGLQFYKRESFLVRKRLGNIEVQQKQLKTEVSESLDSYNCRITLLEKQLLTLNSEKTSKTMDDSIHASLSTLIVYDVKKIPGFDADTDITQSQHLTTALAAVMTDRRGALVKDNPTKKYPELAFPQQLVYLRKLPDKPTSPVLLRFSDPRATSFARQLLSAKGDRNVSVGRIKDAKYQEFLPYSLRLGYALKVAGITPYYNIDPTVYDRASMPKILPQLQILHKGQRTVLRCAAPKSDDESKQLVAHAIRIQLNLDQEAIDKIITHLSQLTPRAPATEAATPPGPSTRPPAQPRVPQPAGTKRDNSHFTPPEKYINP